MAQLFDRVTIVGVGLMGGSLGLALKRRGLAGRVVGVGHRQTSIDEALRLGTIDEGTLDARAGVRGADLVVLCTAIRLIPELASTVADTLKPGCIVTDVGSTKSFIVDEMEKRLPRNVRFVGSHPICGSEKRGVAASDEHLYDRAVCVVTPTERTDRDALAEVRSLWEWVGSKVLLLDPGTHDAILARTSHLPHVVAASLIHVLKAEDDAFAGTGLRDTTRVASGDADLWSDVLLTNAEALLDALSNLHSDLTYLSSLIACGDRDGICRFLLEAKERRDGLFG